MSCAVVESSAQIHFTLADRTVEVTMMPPAEKLASYAGLAGGAALGWIEWPMAVLTRVGRLLSDDRGNRALRALDDA